MLLIKLKTIQSQFKKLSKLYSPIHKVFISRLTTTAVFFIFRLLHQWRFKSFWLSRCALVDFYHLQCYVTKQLIYVL
jgi:hypothetical protein